MIASVSLISDTHVGFIYLWSREKTPPFDHFGEMFMRDTTHGAKAIDSRHIAVPKLLALGSGKPR